MNDWERLDSQEKWNKWKYNKNQASVTVIKYVSAAIFGLAALVQVSGPFG